MVSLITSAREAAPAAASPELGSVSPNKASSPSKPQSASSIPIDTVQISSAASKALQEAIETPAQTVAEANAGDHQAQRLLAKEHAAK